MKMNKELFLRDLERFLNDLPEEDRKQALNYYEDYFEDAGKENEEKVIEELGSPIDIATAIKKANTEQISYGDGSSNNSAKAPNIYNESNSYNYNNTSNTKTQTKTWSQCPDKVAIVVILAILAVPVILPILSGILSFAFGLFIAFLGIIFSFFAVGGSLIVAGFVTFIGMISTLATGDFATSLLLLGIALIFFSLGGLFIYFSLFICKKVIPALFKGFAKLINIIIKRVKEFFAPKEVA